MMAQAAGISASAVRRIWKAHGLQPNRWRQFKLSNDPQFVDKLRDVVGLYVDPPAHAIVLSVDEKSQIQALDRHQRFTFHFTPTSSARTSWASATWRVQDGTSPCAAPARSRGRLCDPSSPASPTVLPSHAVLQQHQLKAGVDQTLAQPLRQWARLKADAIPATRSAKCCNSASGSLATFVSRTILPDESTTQTLLSSSDTSIPA